MFSNILLAIMIAGSCYAFSSRLSRSAQKLCKSYLTTPVANVQSNVILYDGVCNFCNGWVDFLLKVDRKNKFKFAALQSERGMELLEKIGKDRNDLSSVVFIKTVNDENPSENEVYFKSAAAVKVFAELGWAPNLISKFAFLLPTSLRDGMYDIVATNRYNILGKRTDCRCGEDNNRFLN